MASFLIQATVPVLGSMAVEQFLLKPHFGFLYSGKYLPKSYAGVIMVNVVGSSLFMVTLGFKVAGARKACIAQAEKEGDKDAEARFSYPKLYAEGFSEPAKLFNCIQRSHQHALESFSQFLALSIFGGFYFPVATTFGGIYWLVARVKYAEGYSTGDVQRRYEHWSSK